LLTVLILLLPLLSRNEQEEVQLLELRLSAWV